MGKIILFLGFFSIRELGSGKERKVESQLLNPGFKER